MEKDEEKRRRFFPTVSLGSVIATLAFIGSGVGIYTQVIADVNTTKTEIQNLKSNEIKREEVEKASRQEIRQDIRDVKGDVKELNQKLDNALNKVLEEIRRGKR